MQILHYQMKKIKVIKCESEAQRTEAINHLIKLGGKPLDIYTIIPCYVGIDQEGDINGWYTDVIEDYEPEKFQIIKLPYKEDSSIDAVLDACAESSKKCLKEQKTYKLTAYQLKSIAEGKGKEVCPEVFDKKVKVNFDFPTEKEMYDEMDRKFELGKNHHDGMQNDDTQIGWEECYKWIFDIATRNNS